MDCGFDIRGASSKVEALEQVVSHAKHAHQMATIAPDLAKKVDAAIHP